MTKKQAPSSGPDSLRTLQQQVQDLQVHNQELRKQLERSTLQVRDLDHTIGELHVFCWGAGIPPGHIEERVSQLCHQLSEAKKQLQRLEGSDL